MAAKTSTLVWDTPPDGGSDINGYRVMLFEGETLVQTVESEDPFADVTHSPTVERLALIQAVNDQGYSAFLEFLVPTAADTEDPEEPEEPGGGPGAPVAPTITATPGDKSATMQATGGTYTDIVWWRLRNGTTTNLASRGGTTNPFTDTFLLVNGDVVEYYAKVYNGDDPGEGESNHVTVTIGAA